LITRTNLSCDPLQNAEKMKEFSTKNVNLDMLDMFD
jgi:hypothetical protein